MASDENPRKAFEFLRKHFQEQLEFTVDEFKAATAWKDSSFKTYRSKQFRPFLKETSKGKYRVTEAFRRFLDWPTFKQQVATQVRKSTVGDYTKFAFNNVIIFEFYMPLANEAHLKTTLDSLFYRDTILARLKLQNRDLLHHMFPTRDKEAEDKYFERICAWLSTKLIGYSISHVDGRFRVGPLSTRQEVLQLSSEGVRYLVDETTAVTRFIFPCSGEEEAEHIRWFFEILFIDSITELVSGEDEIWMIESGMRNRIHVWALEHDEE